MVLIADLLICSLLICDIDLKMGLERNLMNEQERNSQIEFTADKICIHS